MSTTRLMVIGVARLLQPAHGYLIRQELLSWNVEAWANIAPGSIYSALKTLCTNGYLVECESEPNGNRPGRTAYQVTRQGEAEFFRLLREHLWTVDLDPSRMMAALSFMWALPRQEVLDALENRLVQIDSQIQAGRSGVDLALKNPDTPDHVQEMFLLSNSRSRGELAWTRAAVRRIRSGDYGFEGEEGNWEPASELHAK
jgi:DNA-binding PadR family transcriptional regulator